ncbi:MAG: patatin-like phospholipase family protein [Candidatus Acidiferrum sp.]
MKHVQTQLVPDTEGRRSSFTRRQLLATTAGAAVAAGLCVRNGLAHASTITLPVNDVATSPDPFNDGLAVPFYSKSFGIGKERAIVLGGGGEYWVAWMLGYLHALQNSGVDLDLTDAYVGTSAGSLVGSAVSGGQMTRLTKEFDFFGDFPKLLARVIPTTEPNPSQLRTKLVALACTSSDVATIQQLGRAAMASRNFDVTKLEDMVRVLTGESSWPSPKMHTTSVDCYTGERLVVTHGAGIPIKDACSASASVPGNFGPTWLKNRLCMDGGMCQTSTHGDLVSGVKKLFLLSLTDGRPGSPRLSNMPNDIQQEIRSLKQSGSDVFFVSANPKPGTNLLDPTAIAPAMRDGFARGQAEAQVFKTFWA